jgi:hypothetical protein
MSQRQGLPVFTISGARIPPAFVRQLVSGDSAVGLLGGLLRAELNVAAAYLAISQSDVSPSTKLEHVMKAREAYGNVERLLPDADLTREEAAQIRAAMERVLVGGLLSSETT